MLLPRQVVEVHTPAAHQVPILSRSEASLGPAVQVDNMNQRVRIHSERQFYQVIIPKGQQGPGFRCVMMLHITAKSMEY